MKAGLWAIALLPVLAACGGGGAATSPVSTPTNFQHVQQLKTPTDPPIALTEIASYPLLSNVPGGDFLVGIVWAPDSNVWVSEYGPNKIARVTPSGIVTEFPVPTPGALPAEMAIGPDGNVWFSETVSDAIAKIDIATETFTEFPLDPKVFPVVNGEGPRGVLNGPDGNIWFTVPESSLIGRMSPSGTILNVYTVPTPASGNARFTVGPDRNIWFTESFTSKVGRLNVSTGTIDEFVTPSADAYPAGITTASDGNLWFTEKNTSRVGRITTSGVITEFLTPTQIARPEYMTTTPDGSVWFVEYFNNGLCRVDPVNLTLVEYPASGPALLRGVTAGQGSATVWATDEQGNAVVEFGHQGRAKPRKLLRAPTRGS